MRLLPTAVLLSLGLASAIPSIAAPRPDSQIAARSLSLLEQAQAALKAGELTRAEDLLESALAVDPRNRAAYLALGQVASAQGLPGKAIRFYRGALAIEPNDVEALSGQGQAMVQKGAVERAKANLDRIAKLCKTNCPAQQRLAAAIAKGPPAPVVAAEAKVPPPKP